MKKRSKDIKSSLRVEFTIKDLGVAHLFLGIKIEYTEKGLFLSQMKHIFYILQDYNMLDANPYSTPISVRCKLQSTVGEPLEQPKNYKRLVERLLYLTMTRPDLTFVVQQLSQFIFPPTNHHQQVILKTLGYLKETCNYKLLFPHFGELKLEAFIYVNKGYCIETRKSLSSYCIFRGSFFISLKSKKHTTIARSSVEVE